jgi:hypothetical protein
MRLSEHSPCLFLGGRVMYLRTSTAPSCEVAPIGRETDTQYGGRCTRNGIPLVWNYLDVGFNPAIEKSAKPKQRPKVNSAMPDSPIPAVTL